MWNRLRPPNVIAALRALSEALYRLHELQREHDTPASHLIKLGPNRKPFQFLAKFGHPFSTGGTDSGNLWLQFHFKDFPEYASKTSYPYCKGFSYMAGITILPVKDMFKIVPADNIMDCCNKCRGLFNSEVASRMEKFHDSVSEGCVVPTQVHLFWSCTFAFSFHHIRMDLEVRGHSVIVASCNWVGSLRGIMFGSRVVQASPPQPITHMNAHEHVRTYHRLLGTLRGGVRAGIVGHISLTS
jgi:hypothetical protein